MNFYNILSAEIKQINFIIAVINYIYKLHSRKLHTIDFTFILWRCLYYILYCLITQCRLEERNYIFFSILYHIFEILIFDLYKFKFSLNELKTENLRVQFSILMNKTIQFSGCFFFIIPFIKLKSLFFFCKNIERDYLMKC